MWSIRFWLMQPLGYFGFKRLLILLVAILYSTSVVAGSVSALDDDFMNSNNIIYVSDECTPDSMQYQHTSDNDVSSTTLDDNKSITVVQANIPDRSGGFKNSIDKVFGYSPDFISGNEWGSRGGDDISRDGYKFIRGSLPGVSRGDLAWNQARAMVAMWNSERWSKVDGGTLRITFDKDVKEAKYDVTDRGAVRYDGKRSVVWVTLQDSGGSRLSFIVVHHMVNPSSFPPKDKRKIVYRKGMERLIEKVKELQSSGPVVIAGDFNSQYSANDPWGPRKMLGEVGIKSTFDTKGSVHTHKRGGTIDYIFHSGDLSVKEQWIDKTIASDHNLLGAKLTGDFAGSKPPVSDACVCQGLGPISSSNGVDIDRLLKTIAQRESGGNPTAENSSSSASGKYQYIDGTWKSKSSIYPPSGDYSRAKDAPESVQDAVAYIEYTDKIKKYNGDLKKIALSHFLPRAIYDKSLLDIIPGVNSITPRQYAEGFVKSYESDEGSNISLSYRDAPDFNKYATEAPGSDSVPNINCDDDDNSTGGFVDIDGISMFYQVKEPWASKKYGIGSIKECGCGPTSLAIAAKTIGGAKTNPKKMADWFVENGGQDAPASCGSRWLWSTHPGLFESEYNIKISSISNSASSIKEALRKGDTMVLMSQGKEGMFTTGGHIMLARGVNNDGNILVADPNSEKFTTRESGFTDNEIEKGLKSAWKIERAK